MAGEYLMLPRGEGSGIISRLCYYVVPCYKRGCSHATAAFWVLLALLAPPTITGLAYAPLAGLFIMVVKSSFVAGRAALDGMDKLSTESEPAICSGWLTNLAKKAAGPTKTAIGWLGPLGSLKMTSGMAMTVQGLPYTETSLATLGGGLACVLASLALSPVVAYGTWAAVQGRLEPDYDVEGSVVEVVKAWVWVLWVVAAVPILLWIADFKMKWKLLMRRLNPRGKVGITTNVTPITLYVVPFLFLLFVAIFFTAQDDSYVESILWHVQVCYSDAFAVLRLLRIDWSAPLASVSAFVTTFLGDPLATAQDVLDQLSEFLTDPLAPVQEVIEAAADMTRYLEIDPSYFAEKAAALDVLNVALGVLKLLAIYGRKAFAVFDAVHDLLWMHKLLGGEEEDAEDGTVQVHECLADPVQAQAEAHLAALFRLAGVTREDAERATSLSWYNESLDAKDVAAIVAWLPGNTTLKSLACAAAPQNQWQCAPLHQPPPPPPPTSV